MPPLTVRRVGGWGVGLMMCDPSYGMGVDGVSLTEKVRRAKRTNVLPHSPYGDGTAIAKAIAAYA